jgi:hypothetical protein
MSQKCHEATLTWRHAIADANSPLIRIRDFEGPQGCCRAERSTDSNGTLVAIKGLRGSVALSRTRARSTAT